MLFLYCFEPGLIELPEHSPRHWKFVYGSLDALDDHFRPMGGEVVRLGLYALDALKLLERFYNIRGVYAHQETGQEWTFRRDQAVLAWCRASGITYGEFRQDGVFRGLRNRVGWQEAWEKDMTLPQIHPEFQHADWARTPKDLETHGANLGNLTLGEILEKLTGRKCDPGPAQLQPSGPRYAMKYFNSFLSDRSSLYLKHLARPALARKSCSRISPYLAYGNISVRQIYQASDYTASEPQQQRNLQQFLSRVWWRSHYIQKMESDYEIEFLPLNRGFIGMDRGQREDWLKLWKETQTGFPMVDATLRCLEATGYVNFRMRAMLTTFCAFPMWADFRPIATHLARLFLDYEPGIHFGQFQMQFGQTGYHTLRIFNPIQQAVKYDPEGVFVREWIPELKGLPDHLLYEPWKMTSMEQSFYGCRLGIDYPHPMFDYDKETRLAKERYWEYRMSEKVQAGLEAVWERHCTPHATATYRAERAAEKERRLRKTKKRS